MQKHSLWNTLIKDNIVVTNQISVSNERLKNEYQGEVRHLASLVPLTKFEYLGEHSEIFGKEGINAIIDDNKENVITEVLKQIYPALTGWVVGMGDTIRIGLNNEK